MESRPVDVVEPGSGQHPGGGELVTKQADAQATDINLIVQRWTQTGVVPPGQRKAPMYGDFSGPMDLLSAFERVDQAQAQFEALPSAVRDFCQNDPVRFLSLCADPAQLGKLRELGLVEELDPVNSDKPAVVTPPPDGV